MLSRFLKIFSVILLVTPSLTNADHDMCMGDMTEEACKMEFMKHMEKDVMEKHMDLMKMTMMKMMKFCNDMMMDMPAEDSHMMMMKTCADNMKMDMEMMDKMMTMTDSMKMQEMIEKMYKDMKPDFGTNDEMLEKMMDKHNYDDKMIQEAMMKMMMEMEKIWDHMYGSLREMDMKKYPMYMEMNDMMTKMKSTMDPAEKAKMMMMMMTKMMKFEEMPYMKAMLMAMCHDCME